MAPGRNPEAAGDTEPQITFTENLHKVLPPDTKRAWRELAPTLPKALYLCGGTAVATHLGHRTSRDLDLFYHANAVDLGALRTQLEGTGKFALRQEAPGTLKGLYGATRLEFLHCDQGKEQSCLEEPTLVSGMRIASLDDLAAMKIKTVGDRGELRDYFDLKFIEEQGGIKVEAALELYKERFQVPRGHGSIPHIVMALGNLDGMDEDELLPMTRDELADWWRTRHAKLTRNVRY